MHVNDGYIATTVTPAIVVSGAGEEVGDPSRRQVNLIAEESTRRGRVISHRG